jgi:hypothetical protein
MSLRVKQDRSDSRVLVIENAAELVFKDRIIELVGGISLRIEPRETSVITGIVVDKGIIPLIVRLLNGYEPDRAEPSSPVPVTNKFDAEDRPVSMLGNNSSPFDSSTDFAAARRRTFGVRTPETSSNAGDFIKPALDPDSVPDASDVCLDDVVRQVHAKKLRDALDGLLSKSMKDTCCHDETIRLMRGTTLYDECNQCDAVWKVEKGGKPKWVDPPEWAEAKKVLAATEYLLQ